MKMNSRWPAAIFCGGMLSIALSAQNAPPHRDCAGLTSLTLPDIKISEAVAVPAATSGAIRAAHCRVTGVIGTEIRLDGGHRGLGRERQGARPGDRAEDRGRRRRVADASPVPVSAACGVHGQRQHGRRSEFRLPVSDQWHAA